MKQVSPRGQCSGTDRQVRLPRCNSHQSAAAPALGQMRPGTRHVSSQKVGAVGMRCMLSCLAAPKRRPSSLPHGTTPQHPPAGRARARSSQQPGPAWQQWGYLCTWPHRHQHAWLETTPTLAHIHIHTYMHHLTSREMEQGSRKSGKHGGSPTSTLPAACWKVAKSLRGGPS